MLLIITLFFSAEANWHENVRQAVVCKRRGFNSVVRYTSTVYDWLTFWTLRPDKFQGFIIVSSPAYLVEIAMLRLPVRLLHCNSIDFIFLNAETLLKFTDKGYSHFLFNILSTYMYASTQAFEFRLFSGSILRWWWDLALKSIVVYNFNKLLKKFAAKPVCLRES